MLRYQFDGGVERDCFIAALEERGVAAEAAGATEAGVPARHEADADEVFRDLLGLIDGSTDPVAPRPGGRLVTIHTTDDRFEAEMMADELRGHGIAAAVLGGIDHTTIGVGSVLTNHSVQVHEDDREAAISFVQVVRPPTRPPSARWTSRGSRRATLAVAALLTLGWLGPTSFVLMLVVMAVVESVAWRQRRAPGE